MKQGRSRGFLDQAFNLWKQSATGDLEKIEHLLEGAIAEVRPRQNFQKTLGERLAHQVSSTPIQLEKAGKNRTTTKPSSQAFDFPLLVTGILGGLVLILMGARLLVYFLGNSRSSQT
jgi:hypothetical protein